jgi:hypothetical protein
MRRTIGADPPGWPAATGGLTMKKSKHEAELVKEALRLGMEYG